MLRQDIVNEHGTIQPTGTTETCRSFTNSNDIETQEKQTKRVNILTEFLTLILPCPVSKTPEDYYANAIKDLFNLDYYSTDNKGPWNFLINSNLSNCNKETANNMSEKLYKKLEKLLEENKKNKILEPEDALAINYLLSFRFDMIKYEKYHDIVDILMSYGYNYARKNKKKGEIL